ncbi:sigma 54-interacting transcriptional regulator [Haliangium sp.]|uniref:sigma 54-interacting transcriptional regulator n=1 Tax=Haliangium sp. TaxID=2663208 RepID=UPI003D0E0C76
MTRTAQQHTTQVTETGVFPRIEPPLPRLTSIPALTIIYHPTLRRVGDRVLLSELATGREARIARHTPRFTPPHQPAGLSLGDPRVSRTPFSFRLEPDGGVVIDPGDSRTKLQVHGERLLRPARFSPAQLAAGVIIELADRIALLLHQYDHRDDPGDDELGLVGHSSAMLRVRDDIRRVAQLEVPVLVRGETGTGKELVAGAIHRASPRSEQALIGVNLAALPPPLATAELFGAMRGAFTGAARDREGYFRRAHRGTLFLDEIGETPIDIQTMLLRALETGEIYALGAQRPDNVDVRLVAATDADLDVMVAQGSFRAPLLHRLSGYEIYLPPLRTRRDDIGRLLVYFLGLELAELGQTERLDDDQPWLPMDLMARLVSYDWPGNVRQLRNAARQIVIGSQGQRQATLPDSLVRQLDRHDPITEEVPLRDESRPADGADPARPPPPPPPPVSTLPPRRRRRRKPSQISDSELLTSLHAHRWDIKATAATLGISRTSLYSLIQQSSKARTAGELAVDEIRACHRATRGDLDEMVDRLQVSKRALRRRIKELGLA